MIWNCVEILETFGNLAIIFNYIETLKMVNNPTLIWNYVKTLGLSLIYIEIEYAIMIWKYIGNGRACKSTCKSTYCHLEFSHTLNY